MYIIYTYIYIYIYILSLIKFNMEHLSNHISILNLNITIRKGISKSNKVVFFFIVRILHNFQANNFLPRNIKTLHRLKVIFTHWEIITSENVVFEAQLKIFFISCKSHILFLRSCDVKVSTSTRGTVELRMYLLNCTSSNHKNRDNQLI